MDLGGRTNTPSLQLDGSVHRVAAVSKSCVLAFGQSVYRIDAELRVTTLLAGAMQCGPASGSFLAQHATVHRIEDAALYASLPTQSPITALLPIDDDAIAVCLNGEGYRISAGGVARVDLGLLESVKEDESDEEEGEAQSDMMVAGAVTVGSLSVLVAMRSRGVGLPVSTEVSMLRLTQSDSTPRATSAFDLFESAVERRAAFPVRKDSAPQPAAPLGICARTNQPIQHLSALHLCALCNEHYASAVDACQACGLGLVFPY
jgi:hypothetical protein